MFKKQQILIIHGGSTYSDYNTYINALKNKNPKLEWNVSRKDWKDGLQDKLGDDFIVYVPQMPNKTNAQYEEWKIWFEKIVKQLNENFILIGHSLGGAFISKYLSENNLEKRIKKTFLIAAPFNNEGLEREPLISFEKKVKLEMFIKQAGDVFLYHSEDDFAVPYNHINQYKQELPNAKVRSFNDRGHFIQSEIPELIEDILR
jgi:uncharacterized protein